MKKLTLHLSKGIKGCFESKIQKNTLYLNKMFIIDEILIDNVKNSCEIIYEDKWQIIKLPNYAETIKVYYHGILNGESGLYPYVKERTTDNLYLLRHETIYYPTFYEIDSEEFLEHYLYSQEYDEFLVNTKIDDSRLVISNLEQIDNDLFKGYNPVFVVGDYLLKYDYFGKLYFPTYYKEDVFKSTLIKKINNALLKYKNIYLSNIKIVVIPSGYGSFVMPDHKTMFITEDSFDNPQFLIHEIIHLQWNPKCKSSVQKSRFFDEGITQYLTLRVLDELNIKSSEETERLLQNDFRQIIKNYKIKLEPLCESMYGENGFLSYSYGPLAILQIEKKVGREKIDRAFKKMINDDRLYDFLSFKNLFEDIEDVWMDCFISCNYQNILLK